jgi:hypothetical protein
MGVRNLANDETKPTVLFCELLELLLLLPPGLLLPLCSVSKRSSRPQNGTSLWNSLIRIPLSKHISTSEHSSRASGICSLSPRRPAGTWWAYGMQARAAVLRRRRIRWRFSAVEFTTVECANGAATSTGGAGVPNRPVPFVRPIIPAIPGGWKVAGFSPSW